MAIIFISAGFGQIRINVVGHSSSATTLLPFLLQSLLVLDPGLDLLELFFFLRDLSPDLLVQLKCPRVASVVVVEVPEKFRSLRVAQPQNMAGRLFCRLVAQVC